MTSERPASSTDASRDDQRDVDPFGAGHTFVAYFSWLERVDGIKAAEVRMYGVLASFRGRGEARTCCPSIDDLAARFGLPERDDAKGRESGRRYIRRLLGRLEELGLVRVDRSGNAKGKPNAYHFLAHPGMVATTPGSRQPGGHDDQGPQGHDDPGPPVHDDPGPPGHGDPPFLDLRVDLQKDPRIEGARAQGAASTVESFEKTRALVRREFARRFEAAERSLWTRATDPACDTLARWLLSLAGDVEANLARTLDAFFADPWTRSRHFPVQHLAKYPQKYFEPRQDYQDPRRGVLPPEPPEAFRNQKKSWICEDAKRRRENRDEQAPEPPPAPDVGPLRDAISAAWQAAGLGVPRIMDPTKLGRGAERAARIALESGVALGDVCAALAQSAVEAYRREGIQPEDSIRRSTPDLAPPAANDGTRPGVAQASPRAVDADELVARLPTIARVR